MRWAPPWQRQAPVDDTGLVQRAQHGETEAFEALVRRHQDPIYRLSVRMVGVDAAQDLAQQAFLKAWLRLDQFKGDAAFGTWLYRLAVNTCLDHLRHVNRFQEIPLEEIAPALPEVQDVADLVQRRLDQDAQREALAWALEHLPSEDRLLLALRIGEELAYDAIAEILGITSTTVGTRLFRARARLHALVRERMTEDARGVR